MRASFLCKINSLFACTAVLIAAGSFHAISASVSGEFLIIENSSPAAAIVLPDGASGQLVRNIEIFNNELAESSGARLPVAKAPPSGGNRIEFEVIDSGFKDRGSYGITFPDSRTLRITGTDVSARWALNYLLEEAGIRYLYPGRFGAYYPAIDELKIPREPVSKEASFRLYRGLFAEGEEWQMNLNCEGGNSYWFFNHNLDSIFPREKYGKGEWVDKIMALRGGERVVPERAGFWEACYSSPATASEAIKNISAYFDRHPDRHTYSLAISDSYNQNCQCDGCLEANKGPKIDIITRRDNYSEVYYKWVNEVVEGVIRNHPDRYFGVLAYTGVVNPPSFRLHPNVTVFVCFETYACVDPEAEAQWKELIGEWSKKASSLGIWEYGYGLPRYTLPKVYFRQQARMLRHLADMGGDAGFVESFPHFGEGPKRYLYLKLFYDIDADLDEVLKDWYAAAVGEEAAVYLEKYYDFWENFWIERAVKTSWFQGSKMATYLALIPDGGYMYALEEGDIARCREWMEKVVDLAREHGDEGQRVRAGQLMLEFEFYEASAYAMAAEIVPVSGSPETFSQAVRLALEVPSITGYSARRAETARKMADSFPEWWGGIHGGRARFLDFFGAARMPESLSLLGGYMEKDEVREAVFESLGEASMPEEWESFLVMLADIGAGEIENILPDGSFEHGMDDWRVSGRLSSKQAASGKQSMRITFARDGRFEMVRRVPMTPGRQHYLSAKIYIPADYPPGLVSGKGYILGINEQNVGSNYYIPAEIPLVPGVWTAITTMANPGRCAGHGDIYVIIEGMNKGDTAYVDDIVFVEVPEE